VGVNVLTVGGVIGETTVGPKLGAAETNGTAVHSQASPIRSGNEAHSSREIMPSLPAASSTPHPTTGWKKQQR